VEDKLNCLHLLDNTDWNKQIYNSLTKKTVTSKYCLLNVGTSRWPKELAKMGNLMWQEVIQLNGLTEYGIDDMRKRNLRKLDVADQKKCSLRK
jgi:lipid II:glycine glycyltransferase (peptidoglycan interpeptide bridge formation enzyme)